MNYENIQHIEIISIFLVKNFFQLGIFSYFCTTLNN